MNCDMNKIPTYCSESFASIHQAIGELKKTAEATLIQATRTNGRVADLFERTGLQQTQLRLLQADERRYTKSKGIWGRRIWQATVGLSLLIIGYWLRR